MSFEADMRMIWRSDLSVEAKAVLTAIRQHGDDSGLCRCTIERVVEISSVSRRTVLRRVSELAAAGWLSRPEKGAYVVTEGVSLTPDSVSVTPNGASLTPSMVPQGHRHGVSVTPKGASLTPSRRQPPTPPLEVLSSYDVNATHAPVRTREEPARSAPTTTARPDPVEAILRGHPMAERLRPYVEACLSILGTTPDIFTAESWLARGYSLARVRFGLGQARQAMGPGAPAGRVIVSAGNWMLRAEKHEYAHLEPKPVETPPSEPPRREMTPEERAAAIAKLDALLDDMPRRDGPTREGCA